METTGCAGLVSAVASHHYSLCWPVFVWRILDANLPKTGGAYPGVESRPGAVNQGGVAPQGQGPVGAGSVVQEQHSE